MSGLTEMTTDQLHALRSTLVRRVQETVGHNKGMRLEEEIAAVTEEIRIRSRPADPAVVAFARECVAQGWTNEEIGRAVRRLI